MKITKIYMSDNEILRILPHEISKRDGKLGELAYISISVGSSKNVLNVNCNIVGDLIELLQEVMSDYKL